MKTFRIIAALLLCLSLSCKSESENITSVDGDSDFGGQFFECTALTNGNCQATLQALTAPKGITKIYLTWQLSHSSKNRVFQALNCQLYSVDRRQIDPTGCKVEDFALGMIENSPKFYTNPITFGSPLQSGTYRITADFAVPNGSKIKENWFTNLTVE